MTNKKLPENEDNIGESVVVKPLSFPFSSSESSKIKTIELLKLGKAVAAHFRKNNILTRKKYIELGRIIGVIDE